MFSNVAGAGEATFSSAAAEVSHPVKQGLVQGFSVYIDTVIVCTSTAIMILITGMYNVHPAGMETPLVENIPGVEAGSAYTQAALGTVFGDFGGAFVAVGIFFFALLHRRNCAALSRPKAEIPDTQYDSAGGVFSGGVYR